MIEVVWEVISWTTLFCFQVLVGALTLAFWTVVLVVTVTKIGDHFRWWGERAKP